jgi:hypothetical protein
MPFFRRPFRQTRTRLVDCILEPGRGCAVRNPLRRCANLTPSSIRGSPCKFYSPIKCDIIFQGGSSYWRILIPRVFYAQISWSKTFGMHLLITITYRTYVCRHGIPPPRNEIQRRTTISAALAVVRQALSRWRGSDSGVDRSNPISAMLVACMPAPRAIYVSTNQ